MGRISDRAIVVGTGFGCRIQVPALRAAGFDVAALVGNDAGRTRDRANASGVTGSFVDLAAAVEATGADLVAISTPPFTHAPLVIQAIELGCHVLCEKPFARNEAEASAMLDAASRAGRLHALGNEFRFVPQRAAIGRAIRKGMIGEPRFASFVQLFGFVSTFEKEFPDWWFDASHGGGWLGASGSHAIDQIRSWLGEFSSLSASISTVALTGGDVEDSFSVRFRLENGLEGVLQQSSGVHGSMSEVTRIAGSQGSIWLDGDKVRIADRNGEHDLPIDADLLLPEAAPLGGDPRQNRLDWQLMAAVEIAPYTRLCQSLRSKLQGTREESPVPMATFHDGVANMQVLDAIRRSAREGGRLIEI